MTRQITVKLNESQFGPLLEEIKEFTGQGVSCSHSDLVGKCIFFLHDCAHQVVSSDSGTAFDTILKTKGMNRAEFLLDFLSKYYEFKNNSNTK